MFPTGIVSVCSAMTRAELTAEADATPLPTMPAAYPPTDDGAPWDAIQVDSNRPVRDADVVEVVVVVPPPPPPPPVLPPPENARMWASPERESETNRAVVKPFLVRVSRSMLPMSVDQKITVPSATGVPISSVTTAVTSDVPPCDATNGGFALSVISAPGGAVR
jgi:hypothetical protein